MKKISISKVIEFSRKSEKCKSTFLKRLNSQKQPSKGGGDYWTSCISALRHAFKNNNNSEITSKIDFLLKEIKSTPHKITKNRYQRNIDILYNFEDFNFSKWIPIDSISFLHKNSDFSVININGIPVQVNPTHIFSIENDGEIQIGAIAFVSKSNGYNNSELAAFTDSLFRYLKYNYSTKYKINPSLCITVDATNLNEVTYLDIQKGSVNSILDRTIIEIKSVA